MKKKIILITSLLLVVAFMLGWHFLIPYDKNVPQKAPLTYSEAVKTGKIVNGETSYAIDPNNLNELVGIQDYVFVGKLIKDEGAYYSQSPANIPYTIFKVKVIENIKGELSTSKPIKLYKNVGPGPDGSYYIDQGDIYPEKGNYYVFSVGVATKNFPIPEGSLIYGGPNSNVPLDKDEAKALKSSKVKDFQNAVVNQVSFTRSRGKIVDSEVYLNEPLDQ